MPHRLLPWRPAALRWLIALLSLYRLGLGFIVVVGTGQDHDLIILAQTHDTDTGAVTALHRDLIGVQADDDASWLLSSTSSTSSTILTAATLSLEAS